MTLPPETLLLLIVVLLVIILTLLHHARALAGKRPISRRPLPGIDIVGRALARGAETGRAIHISPGSGSVGARSGTVETVAGLLAAERVATEPGVIAVAAVHRVGELAVGDLAVVVAAAAGHRTEAFGASRRLIDELKAEVPLWKHEVFVDGETAWVHGA